MAAYYNEFDSKAAAWLRELIKRGLIADGDVDERSIVDVGADDLRGYTQCHFFAGIGVWSHALRTTGWSDDRPVWTGSCPCQPFSNAGKRKHYDDERHLWPHWYRLIRECHPTVIFGEQVDAAIRSGWLDDVCLSLESLGYAIGAFDFPACSVGAPHIRQRLYFVAESERGAAERQRYEVGRAAQRMQGASRQQRIRSDAGDGGEPFTVAYTDGGNASTERLQRSGEQRLFAEGSKPHVMADTESQHDWGRSSGSRWGTESTDGGATVDVGNADESGLQGWGMRGSECADQCTVGAAGSVGSVADADCDRYAARIAGGARTAATVSGVDRSRESCAGELGRAGGVIRGATNGFWRDAEWINCRDGKARPVEPGTFPLVDGTPARVGRLRGYGNAIVAPQAATFIAAYIDAS